MRIVPLLTAFGYFDKSLIFRCLIYRIKIEVPKWTRVGEWKKMFTEGVLIHTTPYLFTTSRERIILI